MLDDLKMIHERDAQDVLGSVQKRWQHVPQAQQWGPEVALVRNPAKELAMELPGRSVVVYGGEVLGRAADSWKQSINQYAKQLCWRGELNDAEILGWTKQPVVKPYAVIELRSNLENELAQRRAEAAERLLSGKRPGSMVVHAQGQTSQEQLAYCQAFGEFVAVYLAFLNGVNPAQQDTIDKINGELA